MLQFEGLPEHFKDIKIVNVYEAPGVVGDDWTTYLNEQGEAWIITPLHYSRGLSRIFRKTFRDCRWNARTLQRKKHGDTSWNERKYKLVENTQQDTNKQTGLQEYTMIEYTSNEDKPKHALCRIKIDNKKYTHDILPSATQQTKNMEIDHADAKKEIDHGNKGHKGDYNQQILEREVHELRKHFSYAAIRKVLDHIEIEKLPAASPKEHSTEAPVSNTRKCDRCSFTNTMEAGTSTQGQEQVKVEMLESNSYQGDTTNLHDDTYRNSIEFGEQSSHHGNCNEETAEQGSNPINLAYFAESWISKEPCNSDNHEMAEQNAIVQYPNQLSHNFNENSTFSMDYQNRIEPYPSTSNFPTTEGRLDHQMFEPNAHFLEPKLYHNINWNSIEPVLNNNHLLSWNRNISAPGPSTSHYSAFMGGSDEQMFESDENVLEKMEKGNHLPIYNQSTIAPGLDTNNNATTEYKDMDWINNMV